MGFKLLAIRPLDGCNEKFLKNLEKNRIYKLYNEYEFLDKDDKEIVKFGKDNYIEVKQVKQIKNPTVPKNLFYKKREDGTDLPINISAIVGKNGSGKSSLVELLYAAFYNLSLKKGHINKEEKISKIIVEKDKSKLADNSKYVKFIFDNYTDDTLNLEGTNPNITDKDFIKRNKDFNDLKYTVEQIKKSFNINDYLDNINLELYYETDCIIYKVKFLMNDISYTTNMSCDIKNPKSFSLDKDSLEKLFYNIVVNYSLYGLNTEELGDWLKLIFHKNDGYQTPIVLNPMRTKGNFDINRETELSKSRFFANLIINENLLEVTKENIICDIEIKLKENKRDEYSLKDFFSVTGSYNFNIEKDNISIISDLLTEVFKVTNPIIEDCFINFMAFEYLINKTKSITGTYDLYKNENMLIIINDKIEWNSFVNLIKYFYYEDSSHIVMKVKQVLHFLLFNNLKENKKDSFFQIYKDIKDVIQNPPKEPFNIDFRKNISPIVKERKNKIVEYLIKEKRSLDSVICFLPPSIFEIDYQFTNKSYFSGLSSGEKQNVYSINSILYHLINLNSVHTNSNIKKYEYLNIILDEIELYAHPEMQRKYINILLENIQKLNEDLVNIKGLNFIFITHSPFILSDIPKQNVLFLDKGKPIDNFKRMNTFGANITDLLADSFFIGSEDDKYLMGEFAKEKIEKTIKWLKIEQKSKKDEKENYSPDEIEFKRHESIINIIDEKMIRTKLKEMLYYLKAGTIIEQEFLENEKRKIEERLEELKKQNK